MAISNIRLRLGIRWWVRPFLLVAYVAVVPFAGVVDLEAYLARIAAIAGRYGTKITPIR